MVTWVQFINIILYEYTLRSGTIIHRSYYENVSRTAFELVARRAESAGLAIARTALICLYC